MARAPWIGPPLDEIGVPVAVRGALLEHASVVVELAGATLHPSGVALSIATRWREPDDEARACGEPIFLEGEDGLRFTVELEDGGSASTRDPRPDAEPGQTGPLLRQTGGVGFPQQTTLWLWPLPTGAFVLRADWPAYGIEGQVGVDAFAWPALAPDVLVVE
jgi:hypothetical protein